MSTTQVFGIQHRDTGLWFAGFDTLGAAQWGPKGMPMTEPEAQAQALLLQMFGGTAQPETEPRVE